MRTLRSCVAVVAATTAMGALGASVASATVTFDGTLSMTTWIGDAGVCDFSITASAGPPTNGTWTGSTFAGRSDGVNGPCDESRPMVLTNVSATYSSGMTGSLGSGMTLYDPGSDCTYRTSSALVFTNNLASGDDGMWSGSAAVTSTDFPCFFAPGSLNLTNGHFTT